MKGCVNLLLKIPLNFSAEVLNVKILFLVMLTVFYGIFNNIGGLSICCSIRKQDM